MKKIILLTCFTIGLLSTNSCKKECYTCTSSYDSAEICEDDYASKEEFENAKEVFELLGYTCK